MNPASPTAQAPVAAGNRPAAISRDVLDFVTYTIGKLAHELRLPQGEGVAQVELV